jgi:NodT family efflux transporter outer membrane factor (OMF) lipoprotein
MKLTYLIARVEHAISLSGVTASASRRTALAFVGAWSVILAGCTAVGPDFIAPSWPDQPSTYRSAPTPTSRPAIGSHGGWWSVFQDDELNRLEALAAEQGSSLKSAAARLLQADAQRSVGAASKWPSLGASVSAERLSSSGTTPQGLALRGRSIAGSQYAVGASMSYEIDLWGRLRRINESNQALVDSAKADLDAARLMLSTQVATAYWQWRGALVEVNQVSRLLAVQEETRQLMAARLNAGMTSEADVSRATVDRENILIERENLQRQVEELEHALAALVGQTWSTSLALRLNPTASLTLPPVIPAGVPAQLLQRRPDLVASVAALRAANARIGVAEADLFPSIALTGQYGFASQALHGLFEPSSRQFDLGPLGVHIPLLDGGRSRASLALAKVRYAEAEADHRGKLLTALREVEDALSGENHRQVQWSSALIAQRETQRLVELSTARSAQGLTNYLEVLSAHRNALVADRSAAQIGTQRLVGSVALVRAIGGGWDDASHH